MNNKCVIVLGLGPSGLFVVRQLRNLTSNIYAIGRKTDIGLYSKYVLKNKRFIAESTENVLSVLREISQKELEKPVMYICSDQYLTLLQEKESTIKSYVDIAFDNFDSLRLINDKKKISEYCFLHEIAIPKTLTLSDFIEGQCSFDYPILLKWREKIIDNKNLPFSKIKICNSNEELNLILEDIKKDNYQNEDILVQKYIPGNNDFQYSVGGVYSSGMSLAKVVVKQVSQYPQGISARVITVDNDISKKLEAISENFVFELNYSGFLELEFKVDAKTQEIYLLDINPRPWGWISILSAIFKDFYLVFDGINVPVLNKYVVWENCLRFLVSFKNSNNVKILNKSNRKYKKVYDIFDFKDIIPFLMVFIIFIKKIFK